MKRLSKLLLIFVFASVCAGLAQSASATTRLKDIARIEGARSNDIVGYGIVVGLAGSGDSPRSKATMQSVTNALLQFGINIPADDVNTRNVAAVIITATLPPFSQPGDQIDVNVSSLGDARSLVGGTLLMAPLRAVNDKVYALAQGQVSVGGFQFDFNGNLVQKNHPTVGMIPGGASVERGTIDDLVSEDDTVNVLLNEPDFTTASRLKTALSEKLGENSVTAIHAGKVSVAIDRGTTDIVQLIMEIENVEITPDQVARVVINERTGTVISGGNVEIGEVTISHGEIRVIISTDYQVSQPNLGNFNVGGTAPGVRTVVVPDTEIDVSEQVAEAVDLPSGTSISDLVTALRQIKTSTRDVITILQGIKRAGALHAQLIIQ
ncbi:flagellar basal body P-ring protein FlgI [Flavobacteriaceae bacterium]|nr:flagellar basal body P-ring protein FlgI [Flavobacteriaceae bacterium]